MEMLLADRLDYYKAGEDTTPPPVYPALNRNMDVSLIVNERSEVWLIHTKRLPDILMWAEYDIELRTLTLVFQDGKQQDIGFRVHDDICPLMMKSRQLFLMHLQGDQIVDSGIMPLLVRDPKKQSIKNIIE